MFDHLKFTDAEEAAAAAGVVELPDDYVASAVAPPPQEPQRWPAVLTGRWEDSNPPGTPR